VTHSPSNRSSPAPVAPLGERCRALGLPLWIWNADGELVAEPTGWGHAEPWLRAPLLLEWIEEARRRWAEKGTAEIVDVMPGAWLTPLVPTLPDATHRTAAALALGPEVLRTSEFEAVCRSADLEIRTVRLAMMPVARCRRAELDRHAMILGWMQGDLALLEQDQTTIRGFSRQLVDAYEQISLLYRIADSMNPPDEPDRFVRMACELLHSTLEFQWISVRFAALPTLGPTVANDLIVLGELPCSHTRYDKIAGDMANARTTNFTPTVLEPGSHELADLVGSEVFANPLVCDHRLAGILLAGNKLGEDPDLSTADMQLLSATADYLGAFLHNTAMYNEQRATFLGITKALSASIDAKDRYTRGHSERVAQLASELTLAMGLGAERAERVRLAGLLHDVGKIGVPESVLLKPGKLTEEEFDAIKLHPTIGFNILKEIEPLQDVLPGVLHHHERWDGDGYPAGLRGDQIPLIARLLAVADTFDAMSSSRSYRSALPRKQVLAEIRSCAGTQFDPRLAVKFITLDLGEYDRMVARHEAEQSQAA
jgi:HD-GYP domain-containing protein (c-di-GMP phosphodiesterase class II)